jgi:hypothetical protein
VQGGARKKICNGQSFGPLVLYLVRAARYRAAVGRRRGHWGHWGVESMHWLIDVEFKDDLSRYRSGLGAKNMAIVRCCALGLVRANKTKGSVKTRRKSASWNINVLLERLQLK